MRNHVYFPLKCQELPIIKFEKGAKVRLLFDDVLAASFGFHQITKTIHI